jgi:hypothetical protein
MRGERLADYRVVLGNWLLGHQFLLNSSDFLKPQALHGYRCKTFRNLAEMGRSMLRPYN